MFTYKNLKVSAAIRRLSFHRKVGLVVHFGFAVRVTYENLLTLIILVGPPQGARRIRAGYHNPELPLYTLVP